MQQLLGADDPPAFRVLRPDGTSPFLIVCDHAGRVLPRQLGDLGITESELLRHIGWDIGAAGVARALSERLDAFVITQTYSRLVIDVNRPPRSPQSILTVSERTRVPGNENLSELELRLREEEVFRPYHDRIHLELDRRQAAARRTVLVSMHSFTPSYMDNSRRWHMGVLYNRDPRLAHALLSFLSEEPDLVVGDNEPYKVTDETDYTIGTHGEQRGIPHVEIEIRQDLIAEAPGQAVWAERLASLLERALPQLFPEG
jgi:predicted N-formylglutamate amidohydrolase